MSLNTKKKPRWVLILVIVFVSLALIALILFATPLKTYTNGFLTSFYTDETAEESEKRFDDIDKKVKEFAVTFSNTEGYLNMKITCPEYMAVDKNVISEFYNSYCFSNIDSREIIQYIEQLSSNSKTIDPIYFNSSKREYMELGLDGLVISGAVETNIY